MVFNPGPVTLHCGGNTLQCYVLCPMPQKPGTSEFACWEQAAPSPECMSDIFPLVLSGGSLPGLMQDSHTQTSISTLLDIRWRPHTAIQSSLHISLPPGLSLQTPLPQLLALHPTRPPAMLCLCSLFLYHGCKQSQGRKLEKF